MAATDSEARTTVEVSRRDLQEVLDALRAARDGDVDVRLDGRKSGVMGDVAKAFNQLAERRERLTEELDRVAKVVGREGRLTARVDVKGAKGSWRASILSAS